MRYLLVFFYVFLFCSDVFARGGGNIKREIDDFNLEKIWFDETYHKQNPYNNDEWYVNFFSFEGKGTSGFENFSKDWRGCIFNGQSDYEDYLWDNFVYSYNGKEYGMGVQYYVAYEYSKKGYRFCNVYISASAPSKNDPSYVEYWNSVWQSWKKDCFWLCKPGYYSDGIDCFSKMPENVSAPDMSVHQKRRNLANGTKHALKEVSFRGQDVTERIPVFFTRDADIKKKGVLAEDSAAKNLKCELPEGLGGGSRCKGYGEAQTSEAVLVLKEVKTDLSNDTVTYVAQPLVIRSGRVPGCDMSWPMTDFIGKTDNTMCPKGFKHKTGGGCVAIVKPTNSNSSSGSSSRTSGGSSGRTSDSSSGSSYVSDDFSGKGFIHKQHMHGIRNKGAGRDRPVLEQCWTKIAAEDYKACLLSTGYIE